MAPDRPPEAHSTLSRAQLDRAQLDREEVDRYKRDAAQAAAELVRDGMRVGLGTGSTVAHLLTALGGRASELRRTSCVATSPRTARVALELGLHVRELDEVGELDIAIDGADQVDPDGWLVKGGGGAHTREKIVAAAAHRFVVIVSSNKEVPRLGPPVPLEVLRFGAQHTLRAIGDARPRTGESSPDGNLLADYNGPVQSPRELAARLSATPGVVEHGLFEPAMVSEIVSAGPDGVRRRRGAKPAP